MKRIAKLSSLVVLGLCIVLLPSICRKACAGEKEPEFILKDSLKKYQSEDSHGEFWDFLSTQGYTGVDLDIMDRQGNFYFYSPTLLSLKWTQRPDALTHFIRAMREKYLNKPQNKPKVYLDLSTLAQQSNETSDTFFAKLDKPSPKEVGQVTLDLHDSYLFDGLCSEAFPYETQFLFHWSADSIAKRLNLLAITPGFDDLINAYDKYKFHNFKFNKKDVFNSFDRVVTEDLRPYPLDAGKDKFFPTMGTGDLAIALARTLDKEVWVGCGAGDGFPAGIEHNLFLYRTAQYMPDGYLLLPTEKNQYIYDPAKFNFKKAIKADIISNYGVSLNTYNARKPVANLVLNSQAEQHSEPYFPQYIEPIMNALLANGYDVRVTFGEFLKSADLFYVANSGEWDTNYKFFDDLINLLDEKKSHFYGTVIVHPLGELKNNARWGKIRDIFRIPATEEGWIPYMPPTIKYYGEDVAWRGTVQGEGYGTTIIRERPVRDNFGEVTLSTVYKNQTLALIIKSGTRYLVNGSYLHLQAGLFLSQIMGGALQSPAMAYVTSDRNRTTALALSDTDLKLKIPTLEVAERWKIKVYDLKGEVVQDTEVKGLEVLNIHLSACDLLILQSDNPKLEEK